MQGGKGIQFRPTVVLCLGAEGRAVGEWLSSLLPSLDAPLREAVALLGSDGPAAEDEPIAGYWIGDATAERASDDSSGEREPLLDALPTRIIEALRGRRLAGQSALQRRGVLDDATISRIKDAGYGVPRGMATIWLVAAADSPLLADAIAATQTALRSDGVEGWTLLALINRYPLDPEGHRLQEERCAAQPWEEWLVGGVGVAPLVTFAYLFDTHDERGLFWEGPDETNFAAAEAIFTLTATGLTVTHAYEETLRRSMPRMVTLPQERMSSIATSRLTFPRSQAERYCAYQLGASILREWTPEQAPQLAKEEERSQANAARAAFQRIMEEMASSNALVAALRRRARERSRRRARENELPADRSDARLVLRPLSRSAVEPLVMPRLDLPDALQAQRQVADEGYSAWESALVPAWSRYADEAATEIVSHADDLTMEGAPGVERAYAYIDAFNEAVCDEQDRLDTKRARREARRTSDLAESQTASEGPWLAMLPDGGVGALDEPDDEREARIAARLGARWRWIHARQPELPALIAATILAASSLALLAFLLAPAAWLRAPLIWLPLLLGPSLLAAAITWGFARYRQKLEDDAATDLYRHHRAPYRYRIEKREAEWRETVLAMLRSRCERILDRLTHWEQFIAEIANELARDAEMEEERLFAGAYGRRDVLVANRRRLRRDGYALRDFALDVTKRRQAQPREETPWHASDRELLARLRNAIHGRVSLVEAPTATIAEPVREYCAGIVRPYLTGDLVNLSDALETVAATEDATLLDALLERATLLYHPADQPRAATRFLAAREADLATLTRGKELTGLNTLSMREREWLAVVRLLPGGARPDFLRDRAERTQAPIDEPPEWTTRRGVRPNIAATQYGMAQQGVSQPQPDVQTPQFPPAPNAATPAHDAGDQRGAATRNGGMHS